MDAPADLLAKYTARGEQPGIRDVRYAAMTEALDRVFGRVLDALDAHGLSDNTLVIFTSDNGALLSVADCRPLREGKGYLFEGGIRVPTMMRWPGRIAPGTENTPVISTDYFATMLDAAQLAVPEGGDGESLIPLATGAAPLQRDSIYFHYPNYAFHRANRLGGAIRMGDYKLIERFDDGSLELFDLSQDLGETRNLADAHPGLARDLRDRLAGWRQRVGAAMPTRAR